VAISRNYFAEVGEKGKYSVYPVYRTAPIEYKSIAHQQYLQFRLTVVSLRCKSLCRVYQG